MKPLEPRTLSEDAAAAGQRRRSGFVGRERELDELRAGLETAVSGRGRLFLIVGEPGIGKTRLADEISTEAEAAGARVRWGRCREGAGTPAYWPWIQIVRSHFGDYPAEVLASWMGAGAAQIARIVPEAREWAAAAAEPDPSSSEHEHARFQLFDSVATFLANAARHQPLVAVLDDLHAADPASLLLLEFLARGLTETRILLIGTYREAETAASSPVLERIAALGGEAQSLPLRGLNEVEVARFTERVAGEPPPEGLVRRLHRLTEGNPFFLDQTLRVLLARGDSLSAKPIPIGSIEIPTVVGEAIRRRLDVLSEESRAILSVASVIGRDFDLARLEPAYGAAPGRIAAALAPALRAGVVVDASPPLGRYAFSHTLIHYVLYQDLPPARRCELHRRIAEALEGLHREGRDLPAAEIAHHFFHALPTGDVEKAVEYAEKAAAEALDSFGYEEARAQYERALELHERSGGDEIRRCELLLRFGDARYRLGDQLGARETFLRAADLARALKAPEILARAAFAVGVAQRESGASDRVLVNLLQEGLAAIGDRPSALRVRLLTRLATALYFSGAIEHAASLAEEAVEIAHGLDDRGALAAALEARHFALWGSGDLEALLSLADEIVELAERARDADLALDGRIWRVVDLLESGDIGAVDREIDAIARRGETLRLRTYRWATLLFRATRALLEARFAEGEALAAAALQLGEEIHEPNAGQFFGIQMTYLRTQQGRPGELVEPMRTFIESFPGIPAWRAALAFLYTEAGRLEDARRELEILARDDFRSIPRDGNWLSAAAALSRACAELGDARRAALLYDLLLPSAKRNVIGALGAACYGPVSFFLAISAATAGRFDEATGHFEDAIATNLRLGAKCFLAHTRRDYAKMLLARSAPGDRASAVELLRLALDGYRDLGLEAATAKVTALLEAAESAEAAAHVRVFRKDGELWTIGTGANVFRLEDSKGLHCIAELLRNTGRRLPATGLAALLENGHGPKLDAERARVSITKSIRAACRRISRSDPLLGRHLSQAIRTGALCSYAPDPEEAVEWQLG